MLAKERQHEDSQPRRWRTVLDALADGVREGELQIDRAIFADTQWEPKAVYDWLGFLTPLADRACIPIDVVTSGDIRSDALIPGAFATMPLYLMGEDGKKHMGRRQCTRQYKLQPIYKRIRSFGATYRNPTDLLVGISLDEATRMKAARVKYVNDADRRHPSRPRPSVAVRR